MVQVNLVGRSAIVVGNWLSAALVDCLHSGGASVAWIVSDDELQDGRARAPHGSSPDHISLINRKGASRAQCFAAVHAALGVLNSADVLVTTSPPMQWQHRPTLKITPRDWRSGFRDTLDSVFFTTQAFAQSALQTATAATIVNVTTVRCSHSVPGYTTAAAAAAAVCSLTRSLALEWGPANIRVNALAVGYTHDDSIDESSNDDRGALTRFIPLQRLAESAEIADALLFLISEASRYITGQTIFVDGGYVINGGW